MCDRKATALYKHSKGVYGSSPYHCSHIAIWMAAITQWDRVLRMTVLVVYAVALRQGCDLGKCSTK